MTKTKYIRLIPIYVGLLFFFNPYFAVLDILPDFIGAILICLGLSKLSAVNGNVKDAKDAFFKLIFVDIAKTVCLAITMGAGTTEQPTALLLIAFSAAVVGLFFLIPAMIKLFDALSSLATLQDCEVLYQTRKKGMSRLDIFQKRTIFFLVIKEILCLLPEFSALTLSSYQDNVVIPLYEFIGLMRLIAFILVLVLGIVWLVLLTVLFVKMWRDKPFLARLGQRLADYCATHPGYAIERRYSVSFILLFAGALLLSDFYLDFKNVIPDLAGALLMLVGIFMMRVSSGLKMGLLAAGGVFGVIATVSSSRSYRFLMEHTVSAISRNEETAAAYFTMWLVALLELLAFLAFLALLLLYLRSIVDKEAGYLPTNKQQTEFDARARKSFIEEFDSRFLWCFIAGFLSALCSFLFDYIKELPADGSLYLLEYFWLVDFGLAILFAIFLGHTVEQIYRGIQARYMYD